MRWALSIAWRSACGFLWHYVKRLSRYPNGGLTSRCHTEWQCLRLSSWCQVHLLWWSIRIRISHCQGGYSHQSQLFDPRGQCCRQCDSMLDSHEWASEVLSGIAYQIGGRDNSLQGYQERGSSGWRLELAILWPSWIGVVYPEWSSSQHFRSSVRLSYRVGPVPVFYYWPSPN